MRIKFSLLFIFLLTGCVSPVYYNTTHTIADFTQDSALISEGAQSILAMENQENSDFIEKLDCFEEMIMEGDVLTVMLYCLQRKDRMEALEKINSKMGFTVCNGCIHLPQLSSIELAGLTLQEAKEKIENAYQTQLSQAKVFIGFKELQKRQVIIIGAHQPKVNIKGRTSLFEVLAKAQLPAKANLFKSYVMRDEQVMPVDLYKLIHQGDESQNIVMKNGDQIFIANVHDATVMITGEVPKPMVIDIPYGFLSLREALVTAGDIPFTGSRKCIQVIRGSFVRPKIYCLSWKEIFPLPNKSLLLIPGDVVVISEKPLTQWNRFLSQMQPSIMSMQGSYTLYQSVNELMPD